MPVMSDRKALDSIAGDGPKTRVACYRRGGGVYHPGMSIGFEADAVVAANVELMNAFHQAHLPVVLTTVIYPQRRAGLRLPSESAGAQPSDPRLRMGKI
ncbi:MAG: hypothetical protein CM15mP92_2100 [Halieaceae bacterium]|nr:MAG: hypothetical protein CM15mP92_2100 [Halieaceae bacterium]